MLFGLLFGIFWFLWLLEGNFLRNANETIDNKGKFVVASTHQEMVSTFFLQNWKFLQNVLKFINFLEAFPCRHWLPWRPLPTEKARSQSMGSSKLNFSLDDSWFIIKYVLLLTLYYVMLRYMASIFVFVFRWNALGSSSIYLKPRDKKCANHVWRSSCSNIYKQGRFCLPLVLGQSEPMDLYCFSSMDAYGDVFYTKTYFRK